MDEPGGVESPRPRTGGSPGRLGPSGERQPEDQGPLLDRPVGVRHQAVVHEVLLGRFDEHAAGVTLERRDTPLLDCGRTRSRPGTGVSSHIFSDL